MNVKYQQDMYNENIKLSFLSEYPPKSKSAYRRGFVASFPLEQLLEKDLCQFGETEIEYVLYRLNPKTLTSSKCNSSYISSYINWAINNGYRKEPNPIKTTPVWLKQFVQDDYLSTYINLKQMQEMVQICINKQDGVIIQLLFEGVSANEICKLRKKDVIKSRSALILTDKLGNHREYQISEECLEIILKAMDQKSYVVKNGNRKKNSRFEEVELIDNEYVVRTNKTSNVYFECNESLIRRRVTNIVKEFGRPKLSMTDIFKSGQIYSAFLLAKSGKLDSEVYKRIYQKYNIPKVKMGDNYYYSSTPKDYINEESIKQLYENYPYLLEQDNNNNTIVHLFPDEPEIPWYELAKINGRNGEKAVFYYLVEKYGNEQVEKMQDYFGYDFKVGESMKVEVKSITDIKSPIYMSINEMRKADIYGEEYFLYVLLKEKKSETARLYIVQDPIRFFSIDMGTIDQDLNTSKFASIVPESYRLQLTPQFFKREFESISYDYNGSVVEHVE